METACCAVHAAIHQVCLLSKDLTVGGLARFRTNRGRFFGAAGLAAVGICRQAARLGEIECYLFMLRFL